MVHDCWYYLHTVHRLQGFSQTWSQQEAEVVRMLFYFHSSLLPPTNTIKIAGVTVGTGAACALLAALFFVPYVYAVILKKDRTVKWYDIFKGPLLFKRAVVEPGEEANIPNYHVVQEEDEHSFRSLNGDSERGEAGDITPVHTDEKNPVENRVVAQVNHHVLKTHQELVAEADAKLNAKLCEHRGPMGWAMRTLRDNPMGPGQIYEWSNIKIAAKRLPAMITAGLLYGFHYDIHAAQTGISGTPDGVRMARVYSHATKYPNETEHTYSFVQILTACTASFAHGANDIGNSVGPWAGMFHALFHPSLEKQELTNVMTVIYGAWSTGNAAQSKAPVPVWQIAVLALCISIGLCTYGYNIMKVMGNKITYHSPSRGCSMEMGAAITVLVFSQFSLPVSTSMCITGATVGVGLCNGTLKAVNWQRVGLLMFSWIMTIPVAGTIGGVLMGLFLNAPHFK